MMLPRPTERTAQQGASEQALLVVSPDGRIQFATARARHWLKELSFSPSDRLPHALAGWLAETTPSSRPSSFILERAGTKLCLQVIFREPKSICLLLDQRAKSAPPRGSRSLLTQRQVEVLAWVARGKTNAEIAKILSLKTGTIGKYLERIFPKLGVENRTAAASFVRGPNQTG
ncbi:MAG TPA: LuxR C-terminal-related transcriptional regulator [Chthoniobacterales bacterium]|nr:LuxR C-terminal-related transcriptional regulator [Chthoniobacterales bacterium]